MPALFPRTVATALLLSAFAAQAVQYTVIDLGSFDHHANAIALSVNQAGRAVGELQWASERRDIGMFRSGHAYDLALHDGLAVGWGQAVAINNHNQTAGTLRLPGESRYRGFIEQDGAFTVLAPPTDEDHVVSGLNARGDVIGNIGDPKQVASAAFLFSGGQWTLLPGPAGMSRSVAHGLNNRGTIVGSADLMKQHKVHRVAAWWKDGVFRELPHLPKLRLSEAFGINDAGDVVGDAYGADLHPRAFIIHDGQFRLLDGDNPQRDSYARAVNASGQVIGGLVIDGRLESFVTVDGVATPLKDLLAPETQGVWAGVFAAGLNDAGQIVGAAFDGRGGSHAVLLSPVAD
jgi:probable HAF family extracellular repeat protein